MSPALSPEAAQDAREVREEAERILAALPVDPEGPRRLRVLAREVDAAPAMGQKRPAGRRP